MTEVAFAEYNDVVNAFPSDRTDQPLVKAFNTLPAAVLAADPVKDGGHRVVFLSGNDAEANTQVADLVGKLGFSAINLGSLTQGRLAQFGGPLMVHNLIKHA